MGLLNTMQLQLTMWTMRLARRAGETMGDFRVRAFRSARAVLHACGVERWGTSWLRRWWRFSGHRARCLLRTVPPISAQLDAFRTLEWWERQNRCPTGIRHPQHFPRLANMERAMNQAAQGEWRMVAHNRTQWRVLEQHGLAVGEWQDLIDIGPLGREPGDCGAGAGERGWALPDGGGGHPRGGDGRN